SSLTISSSAYTTLCYTLSLHDALPISEVHESTQKVAQHRGEPSGHAVGGRVQRRLGAPVVGARRRSRTRRTRRCGVVGRPGAPGGALSAVPARTTRGRDHPGHGGPLVGLVLPMIPAVRTGGLPDGQGLSFALLSAYMEKSHGWRGASKDPRVFVISLLTSVDGKRAAFGCSSPRCSAGGTKGRSVDDLAITR